MRWPAARDETPITCTSASTAWLATSSGVCEGEEEEDDQERGGGVEGGVEVSGARRVLEGKHQPTPPPSGGSGG